MILERINSFNSRKVPCAYVITKDENGFAVRTMTIDSHCRTLQEWYDLDDISEYFCKFKEWELPDELDERLTKLISKRNW